MKKRFFSARLLIVLISTVLLTACFGRYYRSVSVAPDQTKLNAFANMNRTFVVHSGSSSFYLSGTRLREFTSNQDSISGTVQAEYPFNSINIPKVNISRRYRLKLGEANVPNEVHLYVNGVAKKIVPGYTELSFATKDIWRVDVNQKDHAMTAFSMIISVFGVIMGLYVVVIAAILLVGLATGSCPFIYENTADGYTLAGEIYSGAVYAPLERHDYLALPRLIEQNGIYSLKMTNEAKEIENTNLAELYVADHERNTEVLFDKYGSCQTFSYPITPTSVTNFNGTDVKSSIASKDEICYLGDVKDNMIPLTDGIIMSFNNPEGASSVKLLIRARNTLWLDYVYKNSHDLFGGYYDNWVRKQNKREPDELTRWYFDQKIPLIVYVEKNGRWVYYDYFNNAGPASFRDDVLAIDLKGTGEKTIRIKLESGAFFWELDYAAMDFSENTPVNLTRVPVSKAVTLGEKDVSGMLKYDDLKYFSQAEEKDNAELQFIAPPETNKQRSVFLHSKGYYQVLSDAKGLPEIKKLRELRKPMEFVEFSRRLMQEKIAELGK